MPSQYPSINTDENISSVYTQRIIVKKIKKTKKYDGMSFLQTKLPTCLNSSVISSVIFNL
jgi:hypothetical protein